MKRIVSVALVLAVVFAMTGTAFAASAECGCGYDPIVYVYGFMRTELVADRGEKTEHSAFPPEAKTVAAALSKLPVPMTKFLCTRDYDYLCNALTGTLGEIMKYLACDDSGKSVYNITINQQEILPQHGEGKYYYFEYDWRLDAYDNARLLKDYVEKVKAATGHSKVAFVGESMGGAVLSAYLVRHGYGSASDIVMNSSAFYGLTMVDELFQRHIDFSGSGLVDYIRNFTADGKPLVSLIDQMLRVVRELGYAEPVANFLDKAIGEIEDKLYAEFLIDTAGNMPGIWAFVSDDCYEKCKAEVLDAKENAALIKTIDKYHYLVRPKLASTLKNARKSGVHVMILSNYGKQCTPVTTNGTYQSDFLIDTAKTSAGAVCAPVGTKLPSGYVQAKRACGHNHISPDKMIDASTCLFPENTWFVKNAMHTVYSEDMMQWFVYGKEQKNVRSSADYPQFMRREDDKYIPLTA